MFLSNRNFKLKLNLGHINIPFIDVNTSDNLFKDYIDYWTERTARRNILGNSQWTENQNLD